MGFGSGNGLCCSLGGTGRCGVLLSSADAGAARIYVMWECLDACERAGACVLDVCT